MSRKQFLFSVERLYETIPGVVIDSEVALYQKRKMTDFVSKSERVSLKKIKNNYHVGHQRKSKTSDTSFFIKRPRCFRSNIKIFLDLRKMND